MLVIYRKDTGEVLHYVDSNNYTQPTVFGVYNSFVKVNYPHLMLHDVDGYVINDTTEDAQGATIRDKLFEFSKVRVKLKGGKVEGLDFVERGVSDPPTESNEQINKKKIKQLEDTIANQQKAIDELMKKVGK